ncbi:MAG: glutamine synthetase III [Cellulosilyticaceae bacterium]
MMTVKDYFGCDVFNDQVMRERLPKPIYASLRKTIDEGLPLDEKIADVVANAMKNWAIEKGATHFTHWFQPMTGITAEKHDAFIQPTGDGQVILSFSGKELIKGEPDASSFPCNRIRSTYEARGYTAWDCTSPAFVKGKSLYIPTAFCAYNGEALDKKTPLLRSMEALNKQALRILRLFGNDTSKRVLTTVGAEQEYFLIDKKLYDQRPDLIFTGRTLFGAKPPKGQERDDHYFGKIKERVACYMEDLDQELWKLGIASKTKHNEVAPAQHEMAPVFTTSNMATDQNQLVMELMQTTALKHDLVCLLHEKPFDGVNGSGKHNNWAMATDDGLNLLEPGRTPQDNAQFLVFLCAIIKAVDDYADLLRLAIASAGNDHRLGANEAPPAIVSIFLGDQLTDILTSLETGVVGPSHTYQKLEIGVSSLPKLPKDATDRNRTSPFAFTGNKFEFRMLGSSHSIAGTNFVLNTIVAEVLSQFADFLEGSQDFKASLHTLLANTVTNHKRIIFNGNNYAAEWVSEAKKRGLYNFTSTVQCLPVLLEEKNKFVLMKHGVLSLTEAESRYEILVEDYIKVLNIEANTMLSMAMTQILPATLSYINELSTCFNAVKTTGLSVDVSAQASLIKILSAASGAFHMSLKNLRKALDKALEETDPYVKATAYYEGVAVAMKDLREKGDKLEVLVAKTYWPFPNYSELLFNI